MSYLVCRCDALKAQGPFWGMQYQYEINEWIQYLVSAMSPLAMYMNPIFSINVGKISQDFWFYFNKQVSFWMRDDSLWANGAEVWLYISGSFCSWNILFSTRQIFVVHSGLPMDPIVTLQDINAVDRPCKTMVRVTLARYHRSKTSTVCWAQLHRVFEKILPKFMSTPLWVRTCLALGEPSLQLLVATCHSQTSPPSMNKWLSTLRHPAQARHDVPIKKLCTDGVPSGAGPTRLQM